MNSLIAQLYMRNHVGKDGNVKMIQLIMRYWDYTGDVLVVTYGTDTQYVFITFNLNGEISKPVSVVKTVHPIPIELLPGILFR